MTAAPKSSYLSAWWRLLRFDKPIGTLLLLWPTLWALWLAAGGVPDTKNLLIFVAGVIVMRAAGCVINDYADRHIDGHVTRTRARPIAAGQISAEAALMGFALLLLIGLALVLQTNRLTFWLSFGAVALAAIYPFMKRHTHLPQVVLGAAFAWSIPMAFAAVTNALDRGIWLVYTGVVLWTVAYDTYYAMVDRPDDLRIGVKSTAILFGDADLTIIFLLQLLALGALAAAGHQFERGTFYYAGLLVACGLFIWQQWIARRRDGKGSFAAFLNNNWVGAAIFVGLALDYQLA